MQEVRPKLWRTRRTYCLHLQSRGITSFSRTKVEGSSETSVNIYHAEMCYIPEDSHLHIHRHDNLTSHMRILDPCNCILHSQEGIVEKLVNSGKNRNLTASVSCFYPFLLTCHLWHFNNEMLKKIRLLNLPCLSVCLSACDNKSRASLSDNTVLQSFSNVCQQSTVVG
jgi:hypothetical protein